MLIGLVGAPNAGKSTFFKALTLKSVEIANYPFTTIKPNEGMGYVTTPCICKELGVTCNPQNSKCVDGIRFIPVRIMDVAGLVPGAHEGKGLGNQFLDDLRQASALIHVLDTSGKTDLEGKTTEGHDPLKTVEMLENEINMWIHEIVTRGYEKVKTISKTEKIPMEKILAKQLSGLGITEYHIKEALKKASPEERPFSKILRDISKPVMIAANKIDVNGAEGNYARLKEHHEYCIPCSAESELALKEAESHGLIKYVPGKESFDIVSEKINEKQKQALEYIRSHVIDKYKSTGVQIALNETVFGLLDMIVVYPIENENKYTSGKGHVLPDAHLVPKGTTVKELAGIIHTEFAERFGSAIDARTKKRIGADHVLQHKDVVKIILSR